MGSGSEAQTSFYKIPPKQIIISFNKWFLINMSNSKYFKGSCKLSKILVIGKLLKTIGGGGHWSK